MILDRAELHSTNTDNALADKVQIWCSLHLFYGLHQACAQTFRRHDTHQTNVQETNKMIFRKKIYHFTQGLPYQLVKQQVV